MKKMFLLDKNKSFLSFDESQKYKGQITKQDNSPVCRALTTSEVVRKGIQSMKMDNYRLVKGKIDV